VTADLRRAKRELPAVDARALDGDWEKQVGIVEIVVVEEIHGAGQKIAGVQGPAAEWNGNAKLMFFIPFTMERDEAQVLIVGGLQQLAGNSYQRRCLIEMPVEGAVDPVQLWNPQRSADARAGSILDDAARKNASGEGRHSARATMWL